MTIRQRIRKLWIGRDLHDYAVLVAADADAAERRGRANAETWLRDNGHAHLIREDRG